MLYIISVLPMGIASPRHGPKHRGIARLSPSTRKPRGRRRRKESGEIKNGIFEKEHKKNLTGQKPTRQLLAPKNPLTPEKINDSFFCRQERAVKQVMYVLE